MNEGTLLVVDDDAPTLDMLGQVLRMANFEVLTATSGTQAIKMLESDMVNLVLLDALMPTLDGFETCKLIKSNHPDLPVIFMTGLGETEHMVAGFDAGGVDYLIKPINHTELLARVKVHSNNALMTQKAKSALDQTGQYLMALDNQGNIQWQTIEAEKLLSALTSKSRELITVWLADQEPAPEITIQQNEFTYHLILLDDPNETNPNESSHLIKIKAQDLKTEKQTLKNKLKITRREAEVLFWVAQGKTDWEISKILSISDRTVNKHLQQIYRKLNVNNRTSASTLALQVLH